jgi:hypothetical protein
MAAHPGSTGGCSDVLGLERVDTRRPRTAVYAGRWRAQGRCGRVFQFVRGRASGPGLRAYGKPGAGVCCQSPCVPCAHGSRCVEALVPVAEAISIGIGAGASAVALLGAGASLRQHHRRRRQRRFLLDVLYRLLKLDVFVSVGAVRLDVRLEEELPWAGYDVWPQRLTGGLNYLDGVRNEAERIGAELRAIDEGDPSVARLRDDAEELCVLLRNAASRYICGTLATYREREGRASPASVSGRAMTPTLERGELDQHRAERDRLTWLFRSCLHRVEPNIAERYQCQWPTGRTKREISPGLVRGPIPAPMDWCEDQVVLD